MNLWRWLRRRRVEDAIPEIFGAPKPIWLRAWLGPAVTPDHMLVYPDRNGHADGLAYMLPVEQVKKITCQRLLDKALGKGEER